MKPDEYRKMFDAEDTHWWYAALHEHIARIVAAEHQRQGPLLLFDAGCGTGRLCRVLSPYGVVSGCEVSDEAIKLCRQRGLAQVHRSDLNTIDLGIDRYDIITSIDVLCQRQIDDDLSVCRKFLDALKPGGLLVLQVPAYEWLRSSHDDAVQTGRRYTRSEVASVLRSSGFFVERATYRVGFLFPPIAALRTLGNFMRRLTGRSPSGSDIKQHSIIVNRMLLAIMRFENAVLSRMTLPFGTSLFMLGRKKAGGASPKAGGGR